MASLLSAAIAEDMLNDHLCFRQPAAHVGLLQAWVQVFCPWRTTSASVPCQLVTLVVFVWGYAAIPRLSFRVDQFCP